MKSTLAQIEKRVAALEGARDAGELPLPGFCPIQEWGESEDDFMRRVEEIRAANPGHRVIPLFVIDGRLSDADSPAEPHP